MLKSFTIGLAGISGSGKNFVKEQLIKYYQDQPCGKGVVVPDAKPHFLSTPTIADIDGDRFFIHSPGLSHEEKVKMNLDQPSGIDFELLTTTIDTLASGSPVHLPIYDFKEYSRTFEEEAMQPAQMIFVDSFLLLADPKIRRSIDFIIYVDTPMDVAFFRRIRRDYVQRPSCIPITLEKYLTVVRPGALEYIIKHKGSADITIDNGLDDFVDLRPAISAINRALANRASSMVNHAGVFSAPKIKSQPRDPLCEADSPHIMRSNSVLLHTYAPTRSQ